jgi:hypothetical protein
MRRMRLPWVALDRLAHELGKHPLEIDPDWDDPRKEPDVFQRKEDELYFRLTIESERQAAAVAALIKSRPSLLEKKNAKR